MGPTKVLFTNMQAGNTMGLAQQRCLRFGVHNQLPSTVPLPQYRYAHAETRAEADWSVQGRGRTRCRLTFTIEEHHLGIRGLPIQHTQGATRGINLEVSRREHPRSDQDVNAGWRCIAQGL